MPELPEVEVSRLGVEPNLVGRRIVQAVLRTPRLRHALTEHLAASLAGKHVDAILRRGKYLLFDCESTGGGGWLILHLGMSGSLRLVAPGNAPQKHDHVDLVFGERVLRLRDPRRFGTLVWHEGGSPETHPLLAHLGIEPLGAEFDGDWLYAQTRERRAPIKPLLMDSRFIVGIGNIYASESLFRARLSPLRTAGSVSSAEMKRLVAAIRAVFIAAIAAGGSSLRDHRHPSGELGLFQHGFAVYGRPGEPCPGCRCELARTGGIRRIVQSGRSTFYCGHRQR